MPAGVRFAVAAQAFADVEVTRRWPCVRNCPGRQTYGFSQYSACGPTEFGRDYRNLSRSAPQEHMTICLPPACRNAPTICNSQCPSARCGRHLRHAYRTGNHSRALQISAVGPYPSNRLVRPSKLLAAVPVPWTAESRNSRRAVAQSNDNWGTSSSTRRT